MPTMAAWLGAEVVPLLLDELPPQPARAAVSATSSAATIAGCLVPTSASRSRGADGNLVAGGRERVPAAAECVQALAVGVAGALVVLEQVERVAVVGHLLRRARAAGRRDKRRVCAAADRGLAGRHQRRPVDRAGAGALAHRSRVPAEQ